MRTIDESSQGSLPAVPRGIRSGPRGRPGNDGRGGSPVPAGAAKPRPLPEGAPRPALLWLSDSPAGSTGYGRIARELLGRLSAKGYPVCCLGRGYDGWPYDHGDFPYQILPTTERDPLGSQALARAIATTNPVFVVAVGDLWMFNWMREVPRNPGRRFLAYVPIDGGPLPHSAAADYKQFDRLITASHFGRRQIEELLPEMKVDVIYHGVDPSVFRPLPNREALLRERNLAGRFVVGCVARNQLRKHLPTLFRAFSRFRATHPGAVLYLHTCPEPGGWALDDFARCFGIEQSVMYTPGISPAKGIPDVKLNEVYNLFDVMVLPTAGEGFGLPILEAMAAGVPVVATDYSACPELLSGRGMLMEVKDYIYLGGQVVRNALPDADDLYEKLCHLASDARLRKSLGRKGRAFAKRLTWDDIIPQWESVFSGGPLPVRFPKSDASERSKAGRSPRRRKNAGPARVALDAEDRGKGSRTGSGPPEARGTR